MRRESGDIRKNGIESSSSKCGDCGISSGANQSRRTFTKSIAASPVIASFIARPVWSSQCSMSGLQSLNLSGNTDLTCTNSAYSSRCFLNKTFFDLVNTNYGIIFGACTKNNCSGTNNSWTLSGASTISNLFGDPLDLPSGTTVTEALDKFTSTSFACVAVCALMNAIKDPTGFEATFDEIGKVVDDAVNPPPGLDDSYYDRVFASLSLMISTPNQLSCGTPPPVGKILIGTTATPICYNGVGTNGSCL